MPVDRPARTLRLAPHWVLTIDTIAVEVRGELGGTPVAGPDFDQLVRDGLPVTEPVRVRPSIRCHGQSADLAAVPAPGSRRGRDPRARLLLV